MNANKEQIPEALLKKRVQSVEASYNFCVQERRKVKERVNLREFLRKLGVSETPTIEGRHFYNIYLEGGGVVEIKC